MLDPNFACVLAIGAILPAQFAFSRQPAYFSVPAVDTPELAQRGPHQVGVRTVDLINPGQIDILAFDKASGKAPSYGRPLEIEVWYPAVIPAGSREHTVYETTLPGRRSQSVPVRYETAGKALRDAAPSADGPFPLVVVSHGYPGSRFFLSYLTENLASKGYVVAAIGHTDSVFGDVKPFVSTLLNRASDQLFTIDALAERSRKPDDFLHGLLDASRVAIIGYSMGGYGAMASGGAGYSKSGGAARIVPGGYLDRWTAGDDRFESVDRSRIKAIVAISPWGAAPPMNNWGKDGLAGLRLPSLFIVGDEDDIAGFDPGVKTLFEGAVNSERCMLVYENARHNIGGNPPPPEALANFSTREFFDEPVWRKDRITAINQHFITAFLDLHLKGQQSRRQFLELPVGRANDGKWPLARGESAGGRYSEGASKPGYSYWKGFHRRWALGLRMRCLGVANSAAAPR